MSPDADRTRKARAAAERALVRVAHHYGGRPPFVLLGGLVPELLCAEADAIHAGTSDIDVQVDLEVTEGAVNAARLERALINAEFTPDGKRVWRWRADGAEAGAEVKFELLTDRDDAPSGATIVFDECEHLGAANLFGTGWAARDHAIVTLAARIGGMPYSAEINVAGLAGFLLAKVFAADSRRAPKDWYDVAFVLLHNDAGGADQAANVVLALLGEAPKGATRSALLDLRANFATPSSQGPVAYAAQMLLNHPEQNADVLRADAVLAVEAFVGRLLG